MVALITVEDALNISHNAKGARVILAYDIRSGADQTLNQETR